MLDLLRVKEVTVDSGAIVIISVSMMLFLGFAMTRLTKKVNLPNVTAYILTGILIGPYCLDLIPQSVVEGTAFLPDLSLAFIAFGTGEFLRASGLRENGRKAIAISLTDVLLAGSLVFLAAYGVLKLDLIVSLFLSALAMTVSPTSTVMTIRQTGAHGDFVDTLLQVVALSDVVGLLAFGVVSALAAFRPGGGSVLGFLGVLGPVILNLFIMILGGGFGWLLKPLLPESRTRENRLILLVSVLCAFCGLCVLLEVSPLLGCMTMGMVYINATGDEELFRQLSNFTPPILLLFFVRSGLTFRLDVLTASSTGEGEIPMLLVGLVYCAVRVLGKYGGSFLGCVLTRKDKRVRNFLGLTLIPQASVAIGLAALGERALGGEAGEKLVTVVLTASLLYELIGPACARMALYRSGACGEDEAEPMKELEEST